MPRTRGGDGAGAGHGNNALILYTLSVIELFAVDTALPLRHESVDGLVAVDAFVAFAETGAFAEPAHERRKLWRDYRFIVLTNTAASSK